MDIIPISFQKGRLLKSSVVQRAYSTLDGSRFLVRNFARMTRVNRLPVTVDNKVTYRPMRYADFAEVKEMYFELYHGSQLNFFIRILYRLMAKKLVLVAERDVNGTIELQGVLFLYLNERDVRENTIHVSFIGVKPSRRNYKISDSIVDICADHYRAFGFSGLSARVSVDNKASISLVTRLGFKPVEKYFDNSREKIRLYLIKKL